MDTPEQTPLPQGNNGEKSVGPIVGIVIIVIILIIGALYVWGQKITENKKMLNDETTVTPSSETDSLTANFQTQSSSDEVDSIQGDLNATSFDSIDQ